LNILYFIILQLENLKVLRLRAEIVKLGGTIHAISTDAVKFWINDPAPVEEWVRLHSDVVKFEEAVILKNERMPRTIRTFTELETEYVNSSSGRLIIGGAGSGKTTKLISLTADKKPLVLCPTHKSKLRFPNAMTICQFIWIYTFTRDKQKLLAPYDCIVIDEYSLIGIKIWNFLTGLRVNHGNIPFYIAGDNKQLKPVNDIVGNFNIHNILNYLCDGNLEILETNHRTQDQIVFTHADLDKLDITGKQPTDWTNIQLHLCYTNVTRKHINEILNRKYGTTAKRRREVAFADGSSIVYAGCRLVGYKTLVSSEIFNGVNYIVKTINWNKKTVTLSYDNKTITVAFSLLTRFRLAYAITIHTSQSETIKEPYVIWDWTNLTPELKYVAFTRASSVENVFIMP